MGQICVLIIHFQSSILMLLAVGMFVSLKTFMFFFIFFFFISFSSPSSSFLPSPLLLPLQVCDLYQTVVIIILPISVIWSCNDVGDAYITIYRPTALASHIHLLYLSLPLLIKISDKIKETSPAVNYQRCLNVVPHLSHSADHVPDMPCIVWDTVIRPSRVVELYHTSDLLPSCHPKISPHAVEHDAFLRLLQLKNS